MAGKIAVHSPKTAPGEVLASEEFSPAAEAEREIELGQNLHEGKLNDKEKLLLRKSLSLDKIAEWATAYREINGSWPTKRSGRVLDKDVNDTNEPIYIFGDLEFEDPIQRDSAVLIELSEDISHDRVDEHLEMKDGQVIFTLSDGRRIVPSTKSHNGYIGFSDLGELRNILSIRPEAYQFGMEYIAECGYAA